MGKKPVSLQPLYVFPFKNNYLHTSGIVKRRQVCRHNNDMNMDNNDEHRKGLQERETDCTERKIKKEIKKEQRDQETERDKESENNMEGR